MAQSTIYSVSVNYEMGGNAAQGLKDVGASAEKAETGLGGLKGVIGEVAAALGLVKGFELGKKAFIDFNSMLEQSTVSIAAQEKMLKGGKWDTAMTNATDLVKYYVQEAKASINTTEDFIQMHKGIAGAGYRIGMNNDEIKQMTKGAILLSSAFGESAQYVSIEVKEMLSGIVNARQRVPAILLSSQGKTREEFSKMDAKAKRTLVLNALKDPALLQAAKAMEFTWKGVTSTLKDNIQIAAGKVGLPLFKQITNEVKGWNHWIDNNGQKLEQYGKAFGDGLITAFTTVKEIVGQLHTIVDVAKDFGEEISKSYLPLKNFTGAAMLSDMVKGISEGAKSLKTMYAGSEVYRDLSGMTTKYTGAREAERKAVGAQMAVEGTAKASWAAPGDRERALANAKTAQDVARQSQIDVQKQMLERAEAAGIVTKTTREGVTSYAPTSREETEARLITGVKGKVDEEEITARRAFIKTLYEDIFGMQKLLSFGEAKDKEDTRAKKLQPEHHKVNVNIHKIEVASPDPDRFVFGMVRSFRQVAENPVTAASTLRGGF